MSIETSLYNKYRPHLLKDIVGQDHIKKTLENSAAQDKIGHAYLFSGVRGTGKCVSPETIIISENGPLRIKNLANQDIKETKEGLTEDLNIKVLGIGNNFNEAKFFYYGGFKKTKKITTKRGYQIICTSDHPILIFNEKCETEFLKSKYLKIGDVIPISRFEFDFKNDLEIKEIKEKTEMFFKNRNKHAKSMLDSKIPNEISKDLAYLVGLIVGDGHLCEKGTKISCGSQNIINEIEKIVSLIFEYKIKPIKDKRRKELYTISIGGKKIAYFFNCLGLNYWMKSDSKEIPDIILNKSRDILSEFIAGIYDSDGIVNRGYTLDLTLNNEKIIRDLQIIFSSIYGINSTVKTKYNKKYNKYYYNLSISGCHNLLLFDNYIKIRDQKKFKNFKEYLRKDIKDNSNINTIPYLKNYIVNFMNERKFSGNGTILNDYGKRIKIKNENPSSIRSIDSKELTFERIKRSKSYINSFSDVLYNKIEKIINDNNFYDYIETIEDGESFVVDLNIPNTNSFVSNGFISHNTSISRILACMVNCENGPSSEYDITSGICKSIIDQSCPDVREVDAASQRTVEDIRALRKEAMQSPMHCKKRVFIIDECHCLRADSSSLLLNVLESPPASSMFVLATTNPQKILPTIKSRCQRFELKRLRIQQIVDRLQYVCDKEGIEVPNKNSLGLIAKASFGSMRDALSFLDAVSGRCGKKINEEEVVDILGLSIQNSIFEILYAICSGDVSKSIIEEKKLIANGSEPLDVFNTLMGMVHDMLVSQSLNNDSFLYIDESIKPRWKKVSSNISGITLSKIINKIAEYISKTEYVPRIDSLLDSCIIELIEIIKDRNK